MNSTTIDAVTLSNLYQLSLVENRDLLGALTYTIIVLKDGVEETHQSVEEKDVAISLFDGFKEYYSKLS